MTIANNPSPCSVDGCTGPVIGRGLCSMHYQRHWKHGTVEARVRPSREERFWAKVNKTDACWLWTAYKSPEGYGRFFESKENPVAHAHRVSYTWCVGPIPEGLFLDHLCRTKACVNPQHLEAVTPRENTMRGESFIARLAMQTHCKRGHEFTPENTYRSKRGGRSCRLCKSEQGKQRYRRKARVDA